MTSLGITVRHLRRSLEERLRNLPPNFHTGFAYVKTGSNLCHPITLGIIAEVVRMLPEVRHVGIDVRLNAKGGPKFQPDIVGFDDKLNPVLFIDFESPNSCDWRIPEKDVRAYLNWFGHHEGRTAPYVVITSLPDSSSPDWELRYVNGENGRYKSRKSELRDNPFRFWQTIWSDVQLPMSKAPIRFLNINDKKVTEFSLTLANRC